VALNGGPDLSQSRQSRFGDRSGQGRVAALVREARAASRCSPGWPGCGSPSVHDSTLPLKLLWLALGMYLPSLSMGFAKCLYFASLGSELVSRHQWQKEATRRQNHAAGRPNRVGSGGTRTRGEFMTNESRISSTSPVVQPSSAASLGGVPPLEPAPGVAPGQSAGGTCLCRGTGSRLRYKICRVGPPFQRRRVIRKARSVA
jgi:hypothetical protein